jgi:hypothetical protein
MSGRRIVDRILAATGQMALFTAVAAAAGFGVELAIARLLDPPAYADMSTLVALAAQLAIGQTVLQLAAARQSATAEPSRSWPRLALVAGVAVALLGLILGRWLNLFWRLPPFTLPFLCLTAVPWFQLGVLRGGTQGSERYRPFGGSLAVENVVRLALTAGLVPFLGVWGGLAGLAGGALVGMIWLGRRAPAFRGPPMPIPWRVLAWTSVGVAATAATPRLDLLVVKHAWPTGAAAAWAALSLFGQGFAQLPWLASTVIFPRVVRERSQRRLYFHLSAAMAAGVLVLAALAGLVAAPAAAHVLFAGRYDAWASVFPVYLWAVVPVALYGMWLSYAIARQRPDGLGFLAAGVAAYLGLLIVHHARMADIMQDYLLLAVWEVAFLLWDARRPAQPA